MSAIIKYMKKEFALLYREQYESFERIKYFASAKSMQQWIRRNDESISECCKYYKGEPFVFIGTELVTMKQLHNQFTVLQKQHLKLCGKKKINAA